MPRKPATVLPRTKKPTKLNDVALARSYAVLNQRLTQQAAAQAEFKLRQDCYARALVDTAQLHRNDFNHFLQKHLREYAKI